MKTLYRAAVLYECNDGPVVYGPFEHVDKAIEWARRELAGGWWTVVPLHLFAELP